MAEAKSEVGSSVKEIKQNKISGETVVSLAEFSANSVLNFSVAKP